MNYTRENYFTIKLIRNAHSCENTEHEDNEILKRGIEEDWNLEFFNENMKQFLMRKKRLHSSGLW